MAAAPSAPASNVPPEWNADPDPIEDSAPAPGAPSTPVTQGALAPKRKAAAEKTSKSAAPKTSSGPPEWDAEPDQLEEAAPAATAQEPPGVSHIAAQGVGDVIDKLGIAGSKLAGAFPVLLDKISSSFMGENTTIQDAWFKHVVDPNVARDAEQQLGPDASFRDRAVYGVSNTAAQIASMFIGGAAMGPAEAATTTGARLLGGAAAMQAPAVSHAVEVGQNVIDATGDKRAAATAAMAAYTTNVGMGLVPGGVGASRVARMATGAAIGAGAGEAARVAENQFLPEGQQAPFDPLNTTLNTIIGGGGAAISHSETGGQTQKGAIEERRATAMTAAQEDAAEIVRKAGGDALDQTVAATQTEATVGAHHDAAAVHQTRLEMKRAQAQEEMARNQEAEQQNTREQGLNAVEGERTAYNAAAQPTADEAYAQRAQANEQTKAQDYDSARVQQAGQETEAQQAGQETAGVGMEKGGALEPKPTLGEALPPEQVSALAALRERLAAQKGQPAPEPSVAERLEQQNPEDDFQKLGPETSAKGSAKPEEEEPEGTRPPPQTPQSLAERRKAALDAAMAAKVRGAPEPAGEAATAAEAPETAPEVKAPPNRLAAIRAAAEKRQLPPAAQEIIDELRAGKAKTEEPKRPPLRQGSDPAEALIDEQVKRDADAAEAARAKEPTARFSDVRQANMVARIQKEAAAARTDMEKARDAGDPRAYQAAADRYDAANDRAMRISRQENDTTRQQPVPPGSKPTGQFAEPATALGDVARAGRMDKDEATQHLKPALSKLPPELRSRTYIHDSGAAAAADMSAPISPANREGLKEHPFAAGMYDPDTNTTHIFAEGHNTGDVEELHKTLAHEYTHYGLRNYLGPKYEATLENVFAKAKNRQWMRKFMSDRAMDASNKDHRLIAADEYAAHLSENMDADPGLWRTVVDGVKRALRSMGLKRSWTDDDIRDLVRRNNPGLDQVDRQARAGQIYKSGARFSEKSSDEDLAKLPPDHPAAIQYKIARTVEEQMNSNRGSVDARESWSREMAARTKAAGSNIGEWARDAAGNKRLGWIGLRNLPDFMHKDLMPDLHGFIDDHDAMDGLRGRLVNKGGDLARKWSKWQAGQDDRGWGLSELMHSSTLLGHDASKPYQSEYSQDDLATDPAKRQDERYQRALHAGLKDTYNNLDPEGREIYNAVRDHYSDQRQMTLDGLTRRINETGADDQTKKNLMAELRQRFEAGKVKGVYFPLQRFGDRWGRAIDPETGEHVSFSRFDNKDDQDQWLKNMRDQGLQVDKGQRVDSKSEMERIDPDFVKKMMSLAHDADSSGGLEKEIWQHYLRAMPEMSMRKHFIMRQGRLGFTQDALRAFSYNSFHGAHQIARLEYGNKLDTRLQNVKDQARALEQASAQNPDDKMAASNAEWAPALARELENRLDWIKNPRASPLASNLTKFGFTWYLGAAPATALRISTQNSMLAQPQLARHFGNMGATKELSRAVLQWARARGKLSDQLRDDGKQPGSVPGERAAFERAADMGMFSNTNTTMLASGGEGQPMTGAYDKFQRVTGYLFNAMEHKNRMTTFLAGYRLAVKKGMEPDEAFNLARNVTWDSHFDYTNANRPAVLQNDVAKVAGLFRQYAWGVTYRMGRDLRDGLAGRLGGPTQRTPEERTAALHAFGSTMARMMLYAGVTGVGAGYPIYSVVNGLVNSLMSTKDTPYDMTAELHKHLNDTMGQTAGDAIMTGPIGAITGAALHSGASYNDMWYKPPDREMKTRDQAMDMLGQAAGPIAAIPMNAATGADLMLQGHFERGLEHFLPPEAAALAKSLRYGREGVKNLKGDTVVDKKDLSKWDLAVQAAGFTPQKVADQYAKNTARENYISQVEQRRNNITTGLKAAALTNDDKEMANVQTQVDAFNKAHPDNAIGFSEYRSIIQEAKAAALSINGVRAPKGLRQEVEDKF